MHVKDTLINFLYDKEYFITMYNNYVYIFNYLSILELSREVIILKLSKFNLRIEGNNLYIKKLLSKELLIEGLIKNVGITYV